MIQRSCDLVVIGAGPGGYVAAVRGARYGLDTVLVEKDDRLGGTCGLRGCIPTKALIQSARTWELCRKGARTFGVIVGEAAFAWDKVLKRKDMVVKKGSLGVAALVDNSGVEVVRGHGRLDGPGRVVVAREGEDPLEIAAAKVILATGSTTMRIPGLEPDGARILTSDHLLEIDAVPASMVILGAGAVGVEFADVMNAFGCKVTLVEMLERIVPLEDADCSAELARVLGRKGVKIHAGHRASDVTAGPDGVSVKLTDVDSGEELVVAAETLLVAAGRRPVTGDLGLDTVDVVVDKRGFVQTDGLMETAVPGLYAIGDIVATPQLAHQASAEAEVAAAHAAGREAAPLDLDRVPGCTYTSPEVASVGLSEAEARERGHEIAVGRYEFAALGKASILNEPHGFVKVVKDAETGLVLGVHMVGPHVTDLISEACAAMGAELDAERWARIIHPHPTLSEAVAEALHAANGEALHG